MATKLEIAEMAALLYESYPHVKPGKNYLKAYGAQLRDLPGALVKAAALDVASEDRDFCPSPGTIRQRAFDLLDRAEGVLSPGEAWASMLEELYNTSIGQRRAEFATPEIEAGVEAVGGIRYLRELKTGDFATRARFLEEYKLQMKRRREQAAMLPEVREVVAMLESGRLKMLEEGENV